MATIPVTHTLAQDQRRASNQAKATQDSMNHGATTIEAQDSGREAGYLIYVYNLLQREYVVQQPPLFPSFIIPACEKGKSYSVTLLPAFVKEPYLKPGSTEFYYKNVDGRKAAMSLLNPSAFPGTDWNSQQQQWNTGDQYGNNLNALGVWWSLTRPDETDKLEREINIFRARATKTMNELIAQGEQLNAAGDLKNITPLMHFAMDYLGKQATWHMSSRHMVTCPNCGDVVVEGIAYHRNSFGDKCIIDRERYLKAIESERPAVPAPVAAPAVELEAEEHPEPSTAAAANKTARSKPRT